MAAKEAIDGGGGGRWGGAGSGLGDGMPPAAWEKQVLP